GRTLWEMLPDVCLLHIFKYLSDGDRSRASLVCHHCHFSYKYVYFFNHSTLKIFTTLGKCVLTVLLFKTMPH
uniref:F-box domain-containing protein n=1 Tax=Poecilia mexicana TaxID=48701 RepID=A0A3B3Y518_9TELE